MSDDELTEPLRMTYLAHLDHHRVAEGVQGH